MKKNVKDCSKVRNNGACANSYFLKLTCNYYRTINVPAFFLFLFENFSSWIWIQTMNADTCGPGSKALVPPIAYTGIVIQKVKKSDKHWRLQTPAFFKISTKMGIFNTIFFTKKPLPICPCLSYIHLG